MRWLSCSIIAVSLLVDMAGARDEAAKMDLEALQGVWQVVTLEVEGKPLPEDQARGMKLTIQGNKASHPGRDGKIEEAAIKLDPPKKPKQIDMSPRTGPGKGTTVRGIYSLEGDTLKICGSKPGHDRPSEFKAGGDVVFIVLKREKS